MIKTLLLLTILLLNCSEDEKTKSYYLANSQSISLYSIKVRKEKGNTICTYNLKLNILNNYSSIVYYEMKELEFYCDKPDFNLVGKKIKLKLEEDK